MGGDNEAIKIGSPALHDGHIGPLLMVPYAADLARRACGLQGSRVLELACGTGIATRALDAGMHAHVVTAK